MFNKVISLILILLLSFSFTACSASESSAISEKNTDASSEISSNNENSGNKWDYSYVPKKEPKELTLDVYMLYTAEDGTVTKVENLLFK